MAFSYSSASCRSNAISWGSSQTIFSAWLSAWAQSNDGPDGAVVAIEVVAVGTVGFDEQPTSITAPPTRAVTAVFGRIRAT